MTDRGERYRVETEKALALALIDECRRRINELVGECADREERILMWKARIRELQPILATWFTALLVFCAD